MSCCSFKFHAWISSNDESQASQYLAKQYYAWDLNTGMHEICRLANSILANNKLGNTMQGIRRMANPMLSNTMLGNTMYQFRIPWIMNLMLVDIMLCNFMHGIWIPFMVFIEWRIQCYPILCIRFKYHALDLSNGKPYGIRYQAWQYHSWDSSLNGKSHASKLMQGIRILITLCFVLGESLTTAITIITTATIVDSVWYRRKMGIYSNNTCTALRCVFRESDLDKYRKQRQQ